MRHNLIKVPYFIMWKLGNLFWLHQDTVNWDFQKKKHGLQWKHQVFFLIWNTIKFSTTTLKCITQMWLLKHNTTLWKTCTIINYSTVMLQNHQYFNFSERASWEFLLYLFQVVYLNICTSNVSMQFWFCTLHLYCTVIKYIKEYALSKMTKSYLHSFSMKINQT